MSLQSPPTLVLRAKKPQLKPGALFIAVGWCSMSIAFLASFHGVGLLVMAVLDVAVIAGALALLQRSRGRSTLSLSEDGLTWTGLFRDRKVCPVKVVEADVHWFRTSARSTRVWLLVNAGGRAEVNLNADAWDQAQLERLRQRLGIPREVISRTQRGNELRAKFPGSVPLAVLHPIALTYLLLAAIVASVLVARHP